MSRIIIVSELFYPDSTSTAHILTKIADHLNKEREVLVLTGPKSYSSFNVIDDSKSEKTYSIRRIKLGSYDKNKVISRTLKLIITSFKLGKLLWASSTKDDCVLTVTNPAPFLIIAAFIKKIRGYELNILVHDVFPENAIAAGIIKSDKNILYRILKTIFSKAYGSADRIIVLGRDMKDVFIRKFNHKKNVPSIEIIENWADSVPDGIATVPIKRDKIEILYAGNIGRCQGVEDFIQIFESADNKYLQLSLRGGGAMIPEIKSKFKDANIILGGSYPRDKQFEILSSCDIALVTLAKGMYGLGVPSKSYNIMAARKPILFIGDLNSEIALTIREHNLGYCFDNSDKEGIREWLANLTPQKKHEFEKMGDKAFQIANTIYSEKAILSKYSQLFSRID